ncbi:MAG TPA: AI-2E family transporter [Albitalea sp.]|uniref:AI-2E family transporter n=1 Tax=Piscinibacter sp. TaxID=1903157 RepID=UPI002ED00AAC
MTRNDLEQKSFLLLLGLVSLAFAWILWPYFGAVFWGVVLAIVFAAPHRRVVRATGGRRNLAATLSLLVCLVVVILPVGLVTAALVQEASLVYQAIQTKRFDIAALVEQAVGKMPVWLNEWLDRFGLGDFASIQDKLAAGAAQASRFIATQALSIGQNFAEFLVAVGVMLYLFYFLLRDGRALAARIDRAVPLSDEHKRHLVGKFTTVIRATIKGNVAVAAVQGLLGGLMLWFLGVQAALLWGVLMALLSLLPAVGAAIVWLPIAVWFLLAGSVWKGVTLIAFGVFVIGLVDNILRPLLVGKDTQMPDWLVLVSTLGGIALFGINGFVIGPVIAALFIAVWDLFSESGQPR